MKKHITVGQALSLVLPLLLLFVTLFFSSMNYSKDAEERSIEAINKVEEVKEDVENYKKYNNERRKEDLQIIRELFIPVNDRLDRIENKQDRILEKK